MADAKISALTNLTAADPTNDMIPIVDVSDTPPASGNTKRISINNILSSSPTASGALTVTGLVTAGSATITGAATVGTTLGVTGVSTFAAGTALLPALTTTGDTNTGIYYPAADTFAVTTGGTERYRVDSTGNLGIGVTPSAWGTYKALQVTNASLWGAVNNAYVGANYYFDGSDRRYIANGFASEYSQASGVHAWFTAVSGTAGNAISFTQAMTLRADGALLVGCTTAPNPGAATTVSGFSLNGDGNNAYISAKLDNSSCGYFRRDGTDGVVLNFYKANNSAGTISVTPTVCTFNSVSDYRLKEAVKPITNGLTRVNALKPASYKWKLNGSDGEGFLAHELSEVVPIAVTGEKDAVNADGSIDAQAIDMSRIVPILVAAIQELTARVQTLEAR